MRVDAFTHFFPKQFFDRLDDIAPDWKDMGKRSRSIAALHDLDVRKKIVDQHKDYQQILSFPKNRGKRNEEIPSIRKTTYR